jgi:hypothetical protein
MKSLNKGSEFTKLVTPPVSPRAGKAATIVASVAMAFAATGCDYFDGSGGTDNSSRGSLEDINPQIELITNVTGLLVTQYGYAADEIFPIDPRGANEIGIRVGGINYTVTDTNSTYLLTPIDNDQSCLVVSKDPAVRSTQASVCE